jgi:hypothetical protein
MNLTGLIENLSEDLRRAADVGGDDVRAAAERLLLALDPALRLTLMDALSHAAGEIGEALPGVVIDVRLRGREPVFVVEGQAPVAPTPAEAEVEDGEASARITLRLPEALKARAETQAARKGQSLNTWLVAAARAAVDGSPPSGPARRSGQRVQGWAR